MDRQTARAWGCTACLLVVAMLSNGPSASSSAPSRSAEITASVDDLFLEVAEAMPGFAGAYVDETSRTLFIRTTNLAAQSPTSAKQRLLDVLRDESLADFIPILKPADYSFADLHRWHHQAREVFSVAGVLSADADEVENRVRIGVESEARDRLLVEERLTSLGVPLAATIIKEEIPEQAMSLQGYYRPAPAGLVIAVSALGTCTLAVNAKLNGVQGFLTNAHCTDNAGQVDGTFVGQPNYNVFDSQEMTDPAFFTIGCPATKVCRFTDAAFIRNILLTSDQGKIAAPPLNPNPGSDYTVWNGVSKYRIIQDASPLVGNQVAKVGAYGGRTTAAVVATCRDIEQAGTNFLFLCQGSAPYSAVPGDSGAPVFASISGGSDVKFHGINWGVAAFSTIAKIHSELGPIANCDPGWTC